MTDWRYAQLGRPNTQLNAGRLAERDDTDAQVGIEEVPMPMSSYRATDENSKGGSLSTQQDSASRSDKTNRRYCYDSVKPLGGRIAEKGKEARESGL